MFVSHFITNCNCHYTAPAHPPQILPLALVIIRMHIKVMVMCPVCCSLTIITQMFYVFNNFMHSEGQSDLTAPFMCFISILAPFFH